MSQSDAPDASNGVLTWTDAGLPKSRLYGDVYFSAQDGLAESRAVFLQGCGLPQAWAGREDFVVGELGFGTGLNVLALLDLWKDRRPANGRLHVFSVEAHPLSAAEAVRALAAWPELAEISTLLLSRWPGRARGFHRVDLPELHATLDVAVMEVGHALAAWTGAADAWFLDGFSPALNPAMWRDEVLQAVAARSAPGARAASFTVAGQVRRGLAAAGFAVAKRPGFGRKRERLEAVAPGPAPARPGPRKVAIVGAGIAGAAAARAVRALGAEPVVFEAEGVGTGASGNPAALVTPRLDAGLGVQAELFASAFARALTLIEAIPGAVLSHGVLQLAAEARDHERFSKIAASDLFEPGAMEILGPQAVEALVREPAPAALHLASALVAAPATILAAWTGDVRRARVAALRREHDRWTLVGSQGEALAVADVVILAAGLACRELWPGLPLSPVRGQASWAWTQSEVCAATWGGYVAPFPGGLLFGATHDRDDEGCELRPGDHARNLQALAKGLPGLARRLSGMPLEGRAAVRAATPDFLPLAGPAPGAGEGLFLLAGFGSRGFSLAPLLAEQVAAQALGAPKPLSAAHAAIVAPERFQRRAARRGRI